MALCLPYRLALTTGHDHWEGHSLDYMDLFTLAVIYSEVGLKNWLLDPIQLSKYKETVFLELLGVKDFENRTYLLKTYCENIYFTLINSLAQLVSLIRGFPGGSVGKESAYNAGDQGSIPGLGRSPGEGKGCPFWYSGLENSKDCIVSRVSHDWATVTSRHSINMNH